MVQLRQLAQAGVSFAASSRCAPTGGTAPVDRLPWAIQLMPQRCHRVTAFLCLDGPLPPRDCLLHKPRRNPLQLLPPAPAKTAQLEVRKVFSSSGPTLTRRSRRRWARCSHSVGPAPYRNISCDDHSAPHELQPPPNVAAMRLRSRRAHTRQFLMAIINPSLPTSNWSLLQVQHHWRGAWARSAVAELPPTGALPPRRRCPCSQAVASASSASRSRRLAAR